MHFYIKEILISLYLLLNYQSVVDRVVHFGFSIKLFAYLGFWALCVLGLFMSAYVQKNTVRVFYAFILFISSIVFDTYSGITATTLNYNSFISLLNAEGFVGEAFRQYASSLLSPILISLSLFIGIALRPNKVHVLSNKFSILSPVIVVFSIAMIMFTRGGDGETGLPSPYIPLTYSVLAVYEKATGVISERKNVYFERDNIKVDYDIIFIVDESIAPRYLDINTHTGIKTNLKDSYNNVDIYNYGYAASITTCSAESNTSLRYGGTRKNYLSTSSNMPSIWRYAKKAGLQTVYIDNQSTGDSLPNKMTRSEVKDIDEYIRFDGIPVIDREMASAKKLVEFINNETREFIYINKIGGHFPVYDKYPDNYMRYKPVLPRGEHKNISEEAINQAGYFSGGNDWRLYRNSYRNTLLWNVGAFFKKIISETGIQDAVVIYTSDHGQDLHEQGNPGISTHCTNNKMEEGMVPLVILQGSKVTSLNWSKYLGENTNQSSHYNIFPTLLKLMHYKESEVIKYYGLSLDMQTKDNMMFNTNYNIRLGGKPTWMKVDLDKKIEPSICDYTDCENKPPKLRKLTK